VNQNEAPPATVNREMLYPRNSVESAPTPINLNTRNFTRSSVNFDSELALGVHEADGCAYLQKSVVDTNQGKKSRQSDSLCENDSKLSD